MRFTFEILKHPVGLENLSYNKLLIALRLVRQFITKLIVLHIPHVLSSSSSQFLSVSSLPTYSQSSNLLSEFNVLISSVIIIVIMENFVFPISVTAAVSNKLRGRRQSPQNNQPRNSVLLLCTLSTCVDLCTFIESKRTTPGNEVQIDVELS